jgi:hypothetical protein
MKRIRVEMSLLCQLFPDAIRLSSLPRKKKKALKKKISRSLMDIALAEAERYIFNKTHGKLMEEMARVSEEFKKLEQDESKTD